MPPATMLFTAAQRVGIVTERMWSRRGAGDMLAAMRPAHLAAVLLTVIGPAGAMPPRDAVERLVAPYIQDEWCMGVVVGLVDEGGRMTLGFGKRSATDRDVPGADTIFEIGSITKPLTALLLAQMHIAGEARLDEPVAKCLPAQVRLPATAPAPMTLLSLATHRSGLPRMPANIRPADLTNPYADYTSQRLHEFLSFWRPARPVGDAYEYSNLGYGLLGQVLATRAGVTYEELLRERISGPLGLHDTTVTLDAVRRKRLAPGHDADGERATNWDFDALAGCGAVRSTVRDMLEFISAEVGLRQTPLSEAMRQTHVAQSPAEGGHDMALGWLIERRTGAIWHNGQTGGYHACIVMDVERKLGVVALANTATMAVDRLSFDLMHLMRTGEVRPNALPALVQVPEAELAAYAGVYIMAPAIPVAITLSQQRLYIQLPGQRRVRLYPAARDIFITRLVEARIVFERDGGKVARLIVHQGGKGRPAVRVAAPATAPG